MKTKIYTKYDHIPGQFTGDELLIEVWNVNSPNNPLNFPYLHHSIGHVYDRAEVEVGLEGVLFVHYQDSTAHLLGI